MLFYSLFKNLIILKICVSFLWLSIPFLYFPRPLNIFFLFSRQGFSIAFGSCPGTNSSRPCWPRTHRDLPASASRVLGKGVRNHRPSCLWFLNKLFRCFYFLSESVFTAYLYLFLTSWVFILLSIMALTKWATLATGCTPLLGSLKD